MEEIHTQIADKKEEIKELKSRLAESQMEATRNLNKSVELENKLSNIGSKVRIFKEYQDNSAAKERCKSEIKELESIKTRQRKSFQASLEDLEFKSEKMRKEIKGMRHRMQSIGKAEAVRD